MDDAILDVLAAPFQGLVFVSFSGGDRGGHLQQAFAGIVAAVEDHVFYGLAQFNIYVLVHRQLARVDDGHGHTTLYGVVEKDGVHGLAQGVVAAEGE